VGEILARDSGSLTVREDAPLETLLGNESLRRLGALIATDADGRIRGVVTVDPIGRALRDPAAQAPGA
jgi:CBS domain-containing protein